MAFFYFNDKTAFEAAPHLRPIILMYETPTGSEFSVFFNAMLSGEFDFFFNKGYLMYKNKVKMDGIFIKGGYSFGERFAETMFAAG